MRMMLPHTPVLEFLDYCVDCGVDFNEKSCCCDVCHESVPLDNGSTVTLHHQGRCGECCQHNPRIKL